MKRIKVLLITLLIAAGIIMPNGNVYSQVTQEWASRYNSTYNLNDIPVGIVVDKFGNSYVTGYSFTTGPKQVATIKYNPAGVQQWAKIYLDTQQPENIAQVITLDTSGNIYVAGYGGNVNTNQYYTFLIKYNSSGDTLWVKKYYGIDNWAQPNALNTDKSNNVYITGIQSGGSFLIKYNSNGDTLWKRTAQESGYQSSQYNSIAIDSTGNVYAGGNAYVNTTWGDFLVVKYSSIGTKLWSGKYGVSNHDDHARKIALDRFSNVYITGTGYNTQTADYYDYLTVKYSSTGVQQWARMYNRSVDDAYNIAVDYSDNIIVTGSSSFSGTSYDFCTIKYNPSGDSQWVRIYSGPANSYDEAYFIKVDSYNNVYVAGRVGSSNDITVATIKYSNNGIQQWVMQYPGVVQTNLGGMTIDNNRNVFVITSNGLNGTGADYITIKYTQFVGIKPITTEIPKQFNLYQNYPNPFNPSTKIKFDIPQEVRSQRLEVRLIIYDVIGREITTLVNEQLKPGTYEVEWDAGNYSGGVYFYKLTTESFSETKKMIILK